MTKTEWILIAIMCFSIIRNITVSKQLRAAQKQLNKKIMEQNSDENQKSTITDNAGEQKIDSPKMNETSVVGETAEGSTAPVAEVNPEEEKQPATNDEIVAIALKAKADIDKMDVSTITEHDVDVMKQLVDKIKERPSAPASLVHKWWTEIKTAEGWVLGEVKNVESKTHNLLINFEDLPEEAKQKVQMLSDLVKSLI